MTDTTGLASEIRGLFSPRRDVSVTEFAESELSLGEGLGPYSTARCRYICEPLEDYRATGPLDVTNCFAAQTFKSTAGFIGVAYRIEHQPIKAMLLYPTYAFAKKFSETKWQPMLDASPVLQRHLPRDRSRFKKLQQELGGSVLHFVGAGKEKNLKGNSVELMQMDELDDIEEAYAKLGKSAVAMAESRTKSFPDSKIFKSGTPTVVRGAVWQSFLAGDRRLFFVDCPCCKGKPFTLEFDPEYTRKWFPGVNASRVVWDRKAKNPDGTWDLERVAATARIECPDCKAHLDQAQVYTMVEKGRWVATVPSKKISRRLPSLYSPHDKTTVAALAVKFLEAKEKPGGLRTFINEELAMPYETKAASISETEIRLVVQHSPEYLRCEIPRDNIALLCFTADVNQGIFHWVTRAWFGDSSSALVDYGTALSWEGLTEASNQTYRVGLKDFSPMFRLIDSGWRTKTDNGVYDFCLASSGRFIPTKGATRSQGLRKTIEESPQEHRGKQIVLIRFDEPLLKTDLYGKIKSRDSKWWLPRNTGPDYEAQLCDEYQKPNGEWESKTSANHYADAEKNQLILPVYIESLHGKGALQKMADLLKKKTA